MSEMVLLGDYTKIKTGKLDANASSSDGQYPFFTCSRTPLKIDRFSYDCECVLVAGNGDLNAKYYNGKFDAYQRTYIIESSNKQILNVRYLYFFLDKYVEKLRELSIGGVIKYIKLENLTMAQLPLPPLPEQQKISSILDKVNELIFKRKRQLLSLDTLIKSRFIEMFGDPTSNPMSWIKRPFGETCAITTGNTPPRTNPSYYGDYIEWIKTDNISTLSMRLSTAIEKLSKAGFEKSRYVEAGSILMTCIAGSLNSIGNVALTDRRVAFNQQINALTPKPSYNELFLYVLVKMMKSEICDAVNMMLKGILSKGKLAIIEAIVPPIVFQCRFADFVQEIEKSKQILQQSLNKLELLNNALMQKYFGG